MLEVTNALRKAYIWTYGDVQGEGEGNVCEGEGNI